MKFSGCKILIIICLLLWSTTSAFAVEPVGTISFLKGSATHSREGFSGKISEGDSVYLKDRIKTDTDSIAEISFLDDSMITMGSSSELEITEYIYHPEKKAREGLFSLLAGKARFFVQTLQNFKQKKIRVQTQTAVVGTRDTDFLVWVQSPEITLAACIENSITFSNRFSPDQQVILSDYMFSQIQGINHPTPPDFMSSEKMAEVLGELRELRGKPRNLLEQRRKRRLTTTTSSTTTMSTTTSTLRTTTSTTTTTTTLAPTTSTTTTSTETTTTTLKPTTTTLPPTTTSTTTTSSTTTTTTSTTTTTTSSTLPKPPPIPKTTQFNKIMPRN